MEANKKNTQSSTDRTGEQVSEVDISDVVDKLRKIGDEMDKKYSNRQSNVVQYISDAVIIMATGLHESVTTALNVLKPK